MTPKVGNFFTNQSLKTKTLIFIVAATAIPLWILMWAMFNSFATASDEVEVKALEQTTGLIRQELLNSVATKAQIYDLTFKNVIIGLGAIKDDATDAERRQRALEDFKNRNHIVTSAYYLPVSETTALPSYFSFMESGQRVFAGRWFGPLPVEGSSSKVMTYGLPVWEVDGLIGVLAFDVSVASILTEVIVIDPSQSSYVMIVRSDGEVVTESEDFRKDFAITDSESNNILGSGASENVDMQRIIAGRDELKGSFDLLNLVGDARKLVVYANVPSFGARLFVVSPLDELIQVQKEKAAGIRAAIQRITSFGVIALFGLSLLLAGAVYVFSENAVIRPLRRLMTGIVHLEQANFEEGVDVAVHSKDEIGSLASRFNNMAARLRESYEGLERKVEERTIEIRKNLSEIERLNKFMIGRELRMRELKDELAKLKGEPPEKSPKV